MNSASDPTASARTVVVLGLARSGTSVITGILKILGVDMGPSLEDNSNPRGSNEDIDFAKLHKTIFDLTGDGRDYWSPPSRDEILAVASKIEPAARALIESKITFQIRISFWSSAMLSAPHYLQWSTRAGVPSL